MTVIRSVKDDQALTLTFVADFDASVERVWQVWEDPRQLERWWGPPGWPATFEQHEFVPGGQSSYYMTGPEGQKAGGWWKITRIDAPHRLEFDDGFADEELSRSIEPTHSVVTLETSGSGTRMTTTTQFVSAEHLERMLTKGMEDGMRLAMGQIDELLAG
ncbi:MAG TPA: SRPBCC domain-containing protein [Pseudonocardiaceae bacterium]|nr:SRPBCC domain-containing protein [Pseudonocardiaceae bacterium]